MRGDLPPEELASALHRTADLVLEHLARIEELPVLPAVTPGEVAAALPLAPPAEGEPMATVLADYERLIAPNVTLWNHPGFMAYIATSSSGPGIVGETLAATLNLNAMLWRTGQAATELEERVCDWLRQMLGLPACFAGHINDTASIGIFLALAAARERAVPGMREEGFGAGGELPRLAIYTSDQAHSSVDKAAIALGLGLRAVRRIPAGPDLRLAPAELAAAIERDLGAGVKPLAVVATAGTTSTGAIDPIAAVGEIARWHGAWFHVDAAYGGGAAICPEVAARLAGWEGADSIIVNPHKWLMTPLDCSVLFLREPALLKGAFSVLPEYLRTADSGVNNLMDYGLQLGKRFRALKLWMVIRAFGVEGLRERIREHLRLAQVLARWVGEDPGFELVAPVELGIVAFRASTGFHPEEEDALNERVMAEVNATGKVFLSHSKLRERYVLRVVIGNIRTEERHVAMAWELIRSATSRRLEEAMVER